MSKRTNSISAGQLRINLTEQLWCFKCNVETKHLMDLAINLGVDLNTIRRYMKGDIIEIRNLELAERILAGLKSYPKKRKSVAA